MTSEQRNKLDQLLFQIVTRENKAAGRGSWIYFLNQNLVHDTDGRDCDWECLLCNKQFINSADFEYPEPAPHVLDNQIDEHAILHLKEYNLLAFL